MHEKIHLGLTGSGSYLRVATDAWLIRVSDGRYQSFKGSVALASTVYPSLAAKHRKVGLIPRGILQENAAG